MIHQTNREPIQRHYYSSHANGKSRPQLCDWNVLSWEAELTLPKSNAQEVKLYEIIERTHENLCPLSKVRLKALLYRKSIFWWVSWLFNALRKTVGHTALWKKVAFHLSRKFMIKLLKNKAFIKKFLCVNLVLQ